MYFRQLLLALWVFLLGASVAAAPNEAYSEAVIDASAQQAWDAFTTKAGLESWMVAKADVDLRVGGMMRTRYASEGELGDEHTIHNQILSLDAPRSYSVRIAKPPKDFPFMNAYPAVWSAVVFDPVSPDKTRVSIRMQGFGQDEEAQKMRSFFLRGNQYTLDKLAQKFKTATP